jgi:hypothetical protein
VTNPAGLVGRLMMWVGVQNMDRYLDPPGRGKANDGLLKKWIHFHSGE